MGAANIYIIRYFCDICGKEVDHQSYINYDTRFSNDLPESWVWFVDHGWEGESIQYACDDCAHNIQENRRIAKR